MPWQIDPFKEQVKIFSLRAYVFVMTFIEEQLNKLGRKVGYFSIDVNGGENYRGGFASQRPFPLWQRTVRLRIVSPHAKISLFLLILNSICQRANTF